MRVVIEFRISNAGQRDESLPLPVTRCGSRSNPNQPKQRHDMKPTQLKQISNLCFILGFASILGSVAIWFLTGGTAAQTQAHAERFGIFVGLWAPTFFILSNRFDRYAEKSP